MKPINSLSAFILQAPAPGTKGELGRKRFSSGTLSGHQRRPSGIDSQSLNLSQRSNLGGAAPAPALSAISSSPADSNDSYQSQATAINVKETEKKLIGNGKGGDSAESQLSVIKIPPLGMFINNKVGSSFSLGQQAATLRSYGLLQPQQLQSLAGAASPQTLPAGGRKVRDSGSLLFMLAFLGLLGYIIWDGLVVKEADINLIIHGHDSYGNICGRNNRPIKHVEKSGKNYTGQPLTKYTLINAQFERYTLDSDRLKFGELFYVKEDELVSRAKLQAKDRGASSAFEPFGATALTTTSALAVAMTTPQAGGESALARFARFGAKNERPLSSANERVKRSLHFEQSASTTEQQQQQSMTVARNNQTLLKRLKSSLMYQYPPLYGYNNPPEPITPSVSPPLNVRDQNVVRYRKKGSTDAQSSEMQFEISASQTEYSLANASTPSMTSVRPLTSTPPTSRGKVSTSMSVIFDDHLTNDGDRYEHMLVAPTSTNSRSRTYANGFSQYEASNQLLYLTECVDYCPPQDHVELIFYRCMPKNWRFSLFPNAINVTRTFIDDIITDLTHCHRELIYIFSLALVLSLALLVLLRFLASVIIWSCIILLISLFLSMASYSWLSYYQQIVDLNNLMPHDSVYSERLASSDKWLVGSIFLTFVALATVATVIFMRRRILLVTSLFRESGKAIADMPLLLLQPLLTFAALLLITAVWSLGLICLQSMKVPIIDMNTGFVVFKAETLYKVMKWYHVFAFLWISHFAIACQHYVIGASVSKWYFSTDRYNLHSPIGSSVSELILYYLGSVALGSFLVAVFKVVRIITRQIQYLVQRNCMSPANNGSPTNGGPVASTISGNPITSTHLSPSCCGSFTYVWRLFIWFFDNIVMIINRDAYVEIAIHGHSFLDGAKRAFTILASNPLKLLAIKSVSNILLVVAKICVVFGTVSMAILLLEERSSQLNYSWSPIVVAALYAYIVAHWFLSVYEMVIDALFICYCEDYERSKSLDVSSQISSSNMISQILNSNNNVQLH